jgi:hypothetical protein
MTAKDREKYNCPNCGAPIGYTERCPYCLTVLEWRPTVIKFIPERFDEHKIEARLRVDDYSLQEKGLMNYITATLAEQISKELPKYWALDKADDPLKGETIFRAVLRVWKRN